MTFLPFPGLHDLDEKIRMPICNGFRFLVHASTVLSDLSLYVL